LARSYEVADSLASKKSLVQQLAALDVLIIDRRALTLLPLIAEWRDELNHFAEQGGHLIILAQDADAWNAKPLWEGMTLTTSSMLAANMPVQVDAGHMLLAKPYQTWYYYGLEKGVEFIFVDRLGNGDYQLVHSTKRGELQDENWQSYLQ
jgi:hypothetical protein